MRRSAVLLPAFLIAALAVPAGAAPVWVRLDLVENTVEGPALDRCEVETTFERGQAPRWRLFYGEARADSHGGWSAVRSSSGCAQVRSPDSVPPWTLRGSPYFLVDVNLKPPRLSGGEVLVDVAFSLQRLTGFAPVGAPTYETNTETRALRVPAWRSAVVPILIATEKEADEFRVRELLLRFHAGVARSTAPVEYGEVAVAADVPRAEIFLDGGAVGRTSDEGPVALGAVRVGEREIIVQDASGRQARAVARVNKGRRTSLSLTLMKDIAGSVNGLRPLGPNRQGAEEQGEFLMGNLETEGVPLPHTVYVSSFLMDKLPLTVGRFKRFAAATGRPLPPDPYWGSHDDFPVAFVRWDEAKAYCEWSGGRLPTEAEREKATRGTDGRMWPWGSEPPSPERAVFRGGWGQDGNDAAGIRPAGASPYGLLDTGGNMWEFCEDWYDPNYFESSPPKDPTGPKTGRSRVVKGGSWDSRPTVLSASSRNFAYTGYREGDFGFRCAADAPR